MYYYEVRKGKEIIAIGESEEDDPYVRAPLDMTVNTITQSVYETYQVFKLFPNYADTEHKILSYKSKSLGNYYLWRIDHIPILSALDNYPR